MYKVWQKVGESADVFPSLMDVEVQVGPPMQLENSGRRREDGGEHAERCTRNAGMGYYQLLEVFKRSEVRK